MTINSIVFYCFYNEDTFFLFQNAEQLFIRGSIVITFMSLSIVFISNVIYKIPKRILGHQ